MKMKIEKKTEKKTCEIKLFPVNHQNIVAKNFYIQRKTNIRFRLRRKPEPLLQKQGRFETMKDRNTDSVSNQSQIIQFFQFSRHNAPRLKNKNEEKQNLQSIIVR